MLDTTMNHIWVTVIAASGDNRVKKRVKNSKIWLVKSGHNKKIFVTLIRGLGTVANLGKELSKLHIRNRSTEHNSLLN